MRIHIVTIGRPKLVYAKQGWDEYIGRLKRLHNVRITHLADKWAYNAAHILQTASNAYTVALAIKGTQYSSPELARFLEKRSIDAREICFLIGGPEGLPQAVIDRADLAWSLSELTFPHDLAMVVALEALYRASTISARLPYHK